MRRAKSIRQMRKEAWAPIIDDLRTLSDRLARVEAAVGKRIRKKQPPKGVQS